MQFIQSSIKELYYSDANTSSPSSPNPQLWFLLPETSGTLPDQIPVDDSWNIYTKGFYIFLDEVLIEANQLSFVQSAWPYLADPSLQGPRFAWFSNPNTAQGGLVGNTISIYLPAGSQQYKTSQSSSFNYQNISFFIGDNCPLTFNSDNSFSIAPNENVTDSIYVSAGWGQTILPVTGAVRLPLDGGLSGCLQFPVQVGQTGGVSDFALLDVGLRYFYPTPLGGSGTDEDGIWLTSLRYPVFNEAQSAVTIYGNLDPLSIDDSRSYFAFNASDAGLPTAQPDTVASNYISTLGNAFSLVPMDGASAPNDFARLAFSQNPTTLPPGPGDPVYLVPKGDFQVQLPESVSSEDQGASSPKLRMMGGLSGVEYVALQSETDNYLSFFNGNPAYAAGFVPGDPSAGSSGKNVENAPTTAWAFLSSKSAPLTYCAQPNQAVLYQSQAASASKSAGDASSVQPLFYLEVPSNKLPASASSASSFPMMPYAGVTTDQIFPPPDGSDPLAIFQQLETQILSPIRRSTVISISKENTINPQPSSSAGSNYGTTPQGLLAEFTSDFSEWSQLVLAQMPNNQQFMLTNIPNNSDMWNSLQTNQLFFVISNPDSIKDYLQTVNSTISMGNPPWNFNLDPAGWSGVGLKGTSGTIMILKFLNKKIVDLAADISTWVQADKFNGSPIATSNTIGQIISQAIDQYQNKGNSDFQYFYQAVTDPNWNGILILNGEAPLSAIPPELAGLAAGIDPALFFAHHIGINASVINQSTDPISLENSMMFGLINYQDSNPLVNGGEDYLFRVTSLKVLFANSQVASFSSEIELMINSMFGESVALATNASANIVEMFGVFQQQVLPDGTIEQSYLFQTAQGSTIVIDMQSQVLNAIQINKAQFITQTTSSTSTETDTRFVFWGLLDFISLEGFDLFSFGREAGATSPAGLSFANLAIDMSFQTSDPSQQTFTFDAGQLSFDLAGSYARTESFFNHFPLTLTGLTQAKSGTTPTGLGFMSVQSPLNQSTLAYPWYSLNFNLNLGTVGALAGEAGFVASLVAAWAPNSSNYSVFTGLSLPGSNGGKREISLEGVLKLTFKTLEIVIDNSSGNLAYILVFYNIALSFLSKTFPPTGQFNIVLFGNPDPQSDNTSLGWYAAYAKPQSNTKKPSQPSIPKVSGEV